MLLAEKLMLQSYYLWDYDWTPLNWNPCWLCNVVHPSHLHMGCPCTRDNWFRTEADKGNPPAFAEQTCFTWWDCCACVCIYVLNMCAVDYDWTPLNWNPCWLCNVVHPSHLHMTLHRKVAFCVVRTAGQGMAPGAVPAQGTPDSELKRTRAIRLFN